MEPKSKVRNSADIAVALLETIEKARAGTVDVAQASVLCKATGTLIALTRLQMEYASNAENPSVAWLDNQVKAAAIGATAS